MSDFQMHPTWWQAADGKWYPPAPPGGGGPGAPALPPPEKKRSKVPLLLGIFCGIPLLLVVLVGLAGALASDDDSSESGSGGGGGATADDCEGPRDTEDTRNLCLYPERPDRQDEDHEAELGQAVRISGYTATATGSQVVPGLLDGQVLVAEVVVENRDDAAQPYNMFDWRLQTPDGQVIDPWGIAEADDSISSGDLVGGGRVEGTVSFEVETTGDHYLIYKPDPFDAARGIWLLPVAA